MSSSTIRLRSGVQTATVVLRGAELVAWGHAGTPLLWTPRPDVWAQTAPWLFPFVGRMRGGGFLHRGRWHSMPIHGFAARAGFECVNHSRAHVLLRLRASERSLACYPFDFELDVSYQLEERGLRIRAELHNPSEEVLPYGLGFHPGFFLPGRIEEWALRFEFPEDDWVWRLSTDPRPLGLRALQPERWVWDGPGQLNLRSDLFARDALIIDPVRSSWVSLVHCRRGERLRVRLGGAPRLGLWARTRAPYVCIEPWWGRDDDAAAPMALLDKPQVQSLAPRARCVHQIWLDLADAAGTQVRMDRP